MEKKIFKFVAENSNVEWSKLSTKKNGTYIGTSYKFDEDSSSGLILRTHKSLIGNVTAFDHSHPTQDPASAADVDRAKEIEQHSPFVVFRIYHTPTQTWEIYDSTTHGLDLNEIQYLKDVTVVPDATKDRK